MSAVTDQTGTQDVGANAGDFDDDEGGGLVSKTHCFLVFTYAGDERNDPLVMLDFCAKKIHNHKSNCCMIFLTVSDL